MNAKHLTVRGLPSDVAAELDRVRRRSGQSLNGTVIGLLRRALGLGTIPKEGNGLKRLAGTWSEVELKEFEKLTASFEKVDPELWR